MLIAGKGRVVPPPFAAVLAVASCQSDTAPYEQPASLASAHGDALASDRYRIAFACRRSGIECKVDRALA